MKSFLVFLFPVLAFASDLTTTYAGDTITIFRESEMGIYTEETSYCVLKIIQRDNGITDIITCEGNKIRLQPKQFFMVKKNTLIKIKEEL